VVLSEKHMMTHKSLVLPSVAILLTLGCGSASAPTKTHAMGELVQTGALVYTVTEAEWRNELAGGPSGVIHPKHRFLTLRVNISNSGSQELSVPLLQVEDSSGASYSELDEVEGVDNWLGLLRVLPPAGTMEGRIAFDVPPAVYRLRVTSGGDPEKETNALVEIPLSVPKPEEATVEGK
jgi:hypothetical protein